MISNGNGPLGYMQEADLRAPLSVHACAAPAAGAVAAAPAAGGAAAAAAPAAKKEEKEESDQDMGFSLFD